MERFNVTFGLLSLYVVISVSYALSRRRGLDPLMPVFFSFMSYILVASPQLAGGEAGTFLDNQGLFTAIVVSVISVEVFNFFVKKGIVIKMPDGVPPADFSLIRCPHSWRSARVWLVVRSLYPQL